MRLNKRLIVLGILISSVAPATVWAKSPKLKSQEMKSKVESAGLKQNPIENVKPASNAAADFYELLERYQGQFIPSDVLKQQVQILEKYTENYLKKIGIKYEKQVRAKSDLQFQGAAIKSISFGVYKLKAIELSADLEAQDKNAVDISVILQEEVMTGKELILNPFLKLENAYIEGYFSPSQNKIEFGLTALSYRVAGISDTLSHELQHAKEQWALEKGQTSLAAWKFILTKPSENERAANANESVPYASYLSLDEIVTHRLDIAFMEEQAPLLEKNYLDTKNLIALRNFRNEKLAQKKEILARIENVGRNGLYSLMSLNSQNKINWSCSADVRMTYCDAQGFEDFGYDQVAVSFKTVRNQKTQDVIQNLIVDSLGLIDSY